MASGTKPSFASMTVGLAVGVTAAVVLACAGGAYLYSQASHAIPAGDGAGHRPGGRRPDPRRAGTPDDRERPDARSRKMMESFRKQALGGAPASLLDRGAASGREGTAASPPPSQAGYSSRVIERANGEVLRTVVPIRNRAECYRCHDPGHKINGILILDYSAGELGRGDDARPALDGGRDGGDHAAAGRGDRRC